MKSRKGLVAVELASSAARAQDHDLGRLVEILINAEVRPPALPVSRTPDGAALEVARDEGDVVGFTTAKLVEQRVRQHRAHHEKNHEREVADGSAVMTFNEHELLRAGVGWPGEDEFRECDSLIHCRRDPQDDGARIGVRIIKEQRLPDVEYAVGD